MNKAVVSAKALRLSEQRLMASGVSEDELIDRAASALADLLMKRANGGKILVVAGTGNNGCDGLSAAEKIHRASGSVTVFSVGENKNPGNEKRLGALRALGVRQATDIKRGEYAVIADCIFGIGLNRAPQGEQKDAIEKINAAGAFVVSADIPSGLDAEDGVAAGAVVRADETLTFTAVKSGMLLGEGRNYTGAVTVAEIGIPCEALGYITDGSEAELKKRETATHKGHYGRISVIGGSDTLVGAPLMSFEAAVAASRAGAGLVTLCVAEESKAAYQARVKETMLCFLPSENGKIRFDEGALSSAVKNANAVAVGMGMGSGEETRKTVTWLIENYEGALVVDADGLNSIVGHTDEMAKRARARLVFTPHIGEFNRLSKQSGTLVERAKALALATGAVVAVKSATTVITDGERVRFNLTGTPALAKGGSGDLLAGITAAMTCAMPDTFSATVAACYHFGKAAERAVKRLNSEVSVLASDVIIEI